MMILRRLLQIASLLVSFNLICGVQLDQNVNYLQRMNVLSRPFTMSGFSSGGSMAIQMQVAFSKHFDGVAAFSATWFRCGAFGPLFYRTICSSGLYPYSKGLFDARRFEKEGLIDPLGNLRNQKLYHWIGILDELANPASRSQSGSFYKAVGMPQKNIHLELSPQGHHFMPTAIKSDYSCNQTLAFRLVFNSNLVGVSYCDYDGAYEGLNFILNNSLTKPNRQQFIALEPLRLFNQSIFLDKKDKQFLDPIGFYYVPSKCRQDNFSLKAHFKFLHSYQPCLLHVSLHGCFGSRSRVGDQFVRQSGYLEVAEINNIIMIFPQSVPFSRNSKGCWDYNGVTGDDYATKNGVQMMAIARMIQVATGQQFLI